MGCIYFETVLNDFVFKWVVTQNIFPLSFNALGSRINGCYSILFSNLKKKEHSIITCRVFSGHMDPMYTETPYILMYIETSYITMDIETPYIAMYIKTPYIALYIETPYITMYIETPYITIHIETSYITMYIETPYITIHIETPYITMYIETPYITIYFGTPYIAIYIETPYITTYIETPYILKTQLLSSSTLEINLILKKSFLIIKQLPLVSGCPRGVMVKALDWRIVVCVFEL